MGDAVADQKAGARPVVDQRSPARPSLLMMHCAFVLTGMATAMLGPILPLLTRQWSLTDQQGGLLLLSQFCGSFLGGATMTRRLRRDLVLGVSAAAIGLGAFALSQGLVVACFALLVGGWGVGHSITAVNLIAGRTFTEQRASRLALLNFFWSFGAMLAPLLTGLLTARFALHSLLLWFAALFLASAIWAAWQMRGGPQRATQPVQPTTDENDSAVEAGRLGLSHRTFFFFAAMLFVYGGLETCMSGWLTTYALRYGDHTLLLSESATLLLWMSLTAGRALSAAVLRRVRELTVWRGSLLLVALTTVGLAGAHTAAGISGLTILLGLMLAPWFPIVFANLVEDGATAQQAGLIIAVSGLGAAALPWCMGFVSTRAGSLQRALAIPFVAALTLLLMSLWGGRSRNGPVRDRVG